MSSNATSIYIFIEYTCAQRTLDVACINFQPIYQSCQRNRRGLVLEVMLSILSLRLSVLQPGRQVRMPTQWLAKQKEFSPFLILGLLWGASALGLRDPMRPALCAAAKKVRIQGQRTFKTRWDIVTFEQVNVLVQIWTFLNWCNK